MDKLKFVFKAKATVDGKSSFIAITAIIDEKGKTFLLPDELQAATIHEVVAASKTYANVKNSIKKRHQSRSVWITLTEEMRKTYFDEDGNMIFEGQYLEEVDENKLAVAQTIEAENPIVKILEKLVENQEKEKKQNVRKLAERFVLEKFDGKNTNTHQWIEFFEKECSRFDIENDEEKIEIFRIFLEKTCIDWYNSMMIKQTLQSEWSVWKQNFCETFANKGWAASRYALSFKYQSGSLLEYAVKKEKLMLEMRKTIDQGTLIDIIAAGLPNFIVDKINKEEILETKDLFNEIGKMEHLVNKRKVIKQKNVTTANTDKKQKCSICEGLQKGVRYHPESACWFRRKDNEHQEKNQIKLINHSELECELQNENPKNL